MQIFVWAYPVITKLIYPEASSMLSFCFSFYSCFLMFKVFANLIHFINVVLKFIITAIKTIVSKISILFINIKLVQDLKFLSRQALPLRGDKNECDSNIIQLLKMNAEQDQILAECLKQKDVYISPTIQNEMIKVMGVSLLHNIVSTLQSTPFLTAIADETTDVSNKEQVTIFLHWVIDK